MYPYPSSSSTACSIGACLLPLYCTLPCTLYLALFLHPHQSTSNTLLSSAIFLSACPYPPKWRVSDTIFRYIPLLMSVLFLFVIVIIVYRLIYMFMSVSVCMCVCALFFVTKWPIHFFGHSPSGPMYSLSFHTAFSFHLFSSIQLPWECGILIFPTSL